LLGELVTNLGLKASKFLNTGPGREYELLEHIQNEFEGAYHAGSSTIDEFSYSENYQFLEGEVYRNSVVGVAVSTDLDISIDQEVLAEPTGEEFEITGEKIEGYVLSEIEGVQASRYFREEIAGTSEKAISGEAQFYNEVSDYFPLNLSEGDSLTGVGAILGKNLLLGYPASSKTGEVYSISGREMLDKLDSVMSRNSNKRAINLVFASGIMLNLMGAEATRIKEKVDEAFEGEYMVLFSLNGFSKRPEEPIKSSVYSLNILSIGKDE
jgi:hypothetical protein